jgi:TolB protein
MSSRDGNAEVYSVTAGSPEWMNLTRTQASENWPEWSPDGRHIAYQSNLYGNLDVWVMNADGSGAKRLTDDPAHDYLPAWSPDGTRITFASWRREPGDTADAVHIYVMNADGTEQRRLFPKSPGTSTSTQWAPDGRSFLLSSKVGDQGADLFVVDSNGETIRRLTNDDFSNGAGVFSPDWQRVAFHSDRGEESDIVVINADGSGRRIVVTDGQNWYPRWLPDGRWLVYTANVADGAVEDLDIYAVPVDGGSPPTRLAGSSGREAEGRWQPRR